MIKQADATARAAEATLQRLRAGEFKEAAEVQSALAREMQRAGAM